MRCATLWLLWIALAVVLFTGRLALAGPPEMPPPRSADEALRSIVVHEGFRVELVAAEPLVMDPVAFDWGGDGRLWVVEMADYPLGVDGKGRFGGRVRWLEDTDGDGRYDRSTLFLDQLGFPSSVIAWRNGAIVTCAPDILYAEDTDGDGRADVRKPLFVGFGEGNPQHRVNGLRWGLDGWIYCANGDSGGLIRSTLTGKEVDLRGRDFRFRPETGEIEAAAGPTQCVRDRDDWDNWFGSNNSHPLWHYVLTDRYLRRNPHVRFPELRREVPAVPGAAPVFPRSATVARFNDLSKSNRFTSACSAIIYRDELLGREFYGNLFVCEPVHNLVHREVLSSNGVTFTSRRAAGEERSEFLASTDNWFRPTMVRTGPDGALWVADMYRWVIEHPEWIPVEWQASMDLRAGQDKGRIYRVFHEERPPRTVPRIDRMTITELVAALENPSGAFRDLAHRALIDRADPASVPSLRALAGDASHAPAGRVAAMAVLGGLDSLVAEELLVAMDDADPEIRRHAARLAEPMLDVSPPLARRVAQLVDDSAPQVVLQATYSLGEWPDPAAGHALGKLLCARGADPYYRAAALSSVNAHNLEATIAAVFDACKAQPVDHAVIESLASLAGVMSKDERWLASIADALTDRADATDGHASRLDAWQIVAVHGLLDGLDRRASATKRDGARTQLKSVRAKLSPALEFARATAVDGHATTDDRVLALSLVGREPENAASDQKALAALLGPQTQDKLKQAALAALATLKDDGARDQILDGWASYSPSIRGQVLDLLLARAESAEALLAAIDARRVLPSEIDLARQERLLNHVSAAVRERAAKVLTSGAKSDRQSVVDQYLTASELPPDAARGGEIFKAKCATCHRLGELGHAVGPDLSALTDKSFSAMAVAVLDPNRALEAKFTSYTAVDVDGLVYTGMLTSESDNSVVLAGPESKTYTLLRADIDQLASSSKSLMPEGLEKELSPQDFCDVVAYLQLNRPVRKVFEGNRPEVVRHEALRGEFWLLASQSEVYGPTLVYEPSTGALEYWNSASDHAVWSLEVERPGKYDVSIEYSCSDKAAGDEFELLVGGRSVRSAAASTGSWQAFAEAKLGQVALSAGSQQVILRSAGAVRQALFDVRAIRIRPAKTQ